MRWSVVLFAAVLGFAAGFVAAKQEQTAKPKTPMDEFLEKVLAEIDASGQQVVMEVWVGLQVLKEAVKAAPVPPAPMPELEAKIRSATERIGTATAVMLAQAFLAAFEKSTVEAPALDSFIFDRLTQFFKVDAKGLLERRQKGWTWTSLTVGLGIAKAAGKPADEVFARYEKAKSWAKVAVELGLKPDALGNTLQGLFQP
jgi:hypothetical protein